MLHTYSLIHDDLPALDNDDLRRGQPTCHIVFGEATAILAGDALQTLAFETLSRLPADPAAVVAILREVAVAVGTGIGRLGEHETGLPPGMIGGQVMDLESEGRESKGKKPEAAVVETIHRAKTGALITVSVVAGGLLGVGSTAHSDRIAHLRSFGQKAGLAFQIVDDVLDVTPGLRAAGQDRREGHRGRQGHMARRLRHRAVAPGRRGTHRRRLRRARLLRQRGRTRSKP